LQQESLNFLSSFVEFSLFSLFFFILLDIWFFLTYLSTYLVRLCPILLAIPTYLKIGHPLWTFPYSLEGRFLLQISEHQKKRGIKEGRSKLSSPHKYEGHSHIAPFDKKDWHSYFALNLGSGTHERRSKECRSCTHCQSQYR
jgi:hypothetical protein